MGKEEKKQQQQHASSGTAESPTQDKPQEKNAKTQTNQTKIKFKEIILKATNNIPENPHTVIS